MDSACPSALALLAATTAVMELSMRVWAGDEDAAAEAVALARVLGQGQLHSYIATERGMTWTR